jgi:hypothetical protein
MDRAMPPKYAIAAALLVMAGCSRQPPAGPSFADLHAEYSIANDKLTQLELELKGYESSRKTVAKTDEKVASALAQVEGSAASEFRDKALEADAAYEAKIAEMRAAIEEQKEKVAEAKRQMEAVSPK